MAQFKPEDVKKVERVQISARELRRIADKLEKVKETDENVEIDLYLIPSKDGKAPQIAFDLSKDVVSEEPKKKENVIEKPEVKEIKSDAEIPKETKPAEEKKEVAPETKDAPKVKVPEEKLTEQPKKEEITEAPVEPVKEVSQALTKEEIAEKAKVINDSVQKKLNSEN